MAHRNRRIDGLGLGGGRRVRRRWTGGQSRGSRWVRNGFDPGRRSRCSPSAVATITRSAAWEVQYVEAVARKGELKLCAQQECNQHQARGRAAEMKKVFWCSSCDRYHHLLSSRRTRSASGFLAASSARYYICWPCWVDP